MDTQLVDVAQSLNLIVAWEKVGMGYAYVARRELTREVEGLRLHVGIAASGATLRKAIEGAIPAVERLRSEGWT